MDLISVQIRVTADTNMTLCDFGQRQHSVFTYVQHISNSPAYKHIRLIEDKTLQLYTVVLHCLLALHTVTVDYKPEVDTL